MINPKIKNNNSGLVSPKFRRNEGGFTLVETMFAVFILTSTIVGLMTVVSNSLFAARYARDEISVNYLLQEVVDYIRNDRDTTVFLKNGGTWESFQAPYIVCLNETTGCYFDVLTSSAVTPTVCPPASGCPYFYYDKDANTTPFYVTDNFTNMGSKVKTNFRRKIVVVQNGTDEIDVTVTIDWLNGNLPMTRSLKTSFMKWQ